jgi:ubiquinone biosynthesis protein
MAISLQPSHLKRYKDIAWIAYRYGGSHVGKSTKELEKIVGGDQQPHTAADLESAATAEELANDLEKMGPTFIKIGQLLSTRSDILPAVYIQALTRLQDKVKPFDFAEVDKAISSELGVRTSRAFASIDQKPIAAASLGQVHQATMRDGRMVAVKVQRPGIREELINDLDSLHEVALMLDQHTEFGRKYELDRALEDLRKNLMLELDYRQEAQNLITLGRNLKEFDRIMVPQPIDDYTTTRILTMEYVSGHKITKLSPAVRLEIDGAVLAEQIFAAYLKQVLIDGFFHADPHPGNVLLTQDSRVALLDLGMVARVRTSVQDGLTQILLAVSEGRGEAAAEHLIHISEKRENFDEKAFIRAASEMVATHKDATLKQISTGRILMDISRMAADNGVRTPSEFTTLGKTLMNLDQLGTTLDGNFNPNESIRKNASDIIRRKLTDSLTMGNLYSGMLEMKEFTQQLPGRVNKILDKVSNNEIEVSVDAIDEDKLMAGFQKVANRIAVGLILSALIIGAALLTTVETSEGGVKLMGYPALATILFIAAAAGGIWLTVHILINDRKA